MNDAILVLAGTSTDNAVILKKLDDMMRLLELSSAIQLDRFTYTEGKVTCKNDSQAKAFSKRVQKAYAAMDHGQCWCMLTNARLPSSTVIASHLFKWEWAEYTYILDINDTRNGIPLWMPLERAFATSRLCFTYNKDTDHFIANVLDPNILAWKLSDVGRDKMGAKWVNPPNQLQNLTFKHVDLQPLSFAPSSLERPLKGS